jgi:hypothetical protein
MKVGRWTLRGRTPQHEQTKDKEDSWLQTVAYPVLSQPRTRHPMRCKANRSRSWDTATWANPLP